MTVGKLLAARQRLRAKGRRVEGRKLVRDASERAGADRPHACVRRKPVKGDRLSYAAIRSCR